MSKPLSCRYTGTARLLLCAALVKAEVEAVAEVRREWCRAKALLMAASPTRVGNTSTCSPLLAVKHNSRGGPRFRAGRFQASGVWGGGEGGVSRFRAVVLKVQGRWGFKTQGRRGGPRFRAWGVRGSRQAGIKVQGRVAA